MGQIAIVTDVFSDTLGTAAASSPLQAKACTSDAYDVGKFWNERFSAQAKSLFKSQAHTFMSIPSIYDGSIAEHANRYYGSFTTTPEAVLSPLVIRKEYDPERGQRLPFKEFKRRQAAGEILLSPTLNRGIKITVNPGYELAVQQAAHVLGAVNHSDLFLNQYPFKPSGCQYWPSRRYDEHSNTFRGVIPGTFAQYTRYTFAGNMKHPISVARANSWVSDLWSNISALEVDTGLVTSARSEAAAGIIDLTTTLAEMPETLKMIYEALRLILAKYLEVRRKIDVLKENKINQADFVSQVTALWMQYRYGIMPNVYAIHDGLEYLKSEVVRYQTVRQGAETELEIPPLDGWEASEIVTCKLRAFIKNRFAIENLAKSAAFLRTDLLSTAWELIPLSFVVDWALNVGDFLSSLSAPTGSIQEAAQFSWHIDKASVELRNPAWRLGTIEVNFGAYRSDIIQPSDHIGLNVQLSMTVQRVLDSLALAWGFTSSDFKRNLTKRRR